MFELLGLIFGGVSRLAQHWLDLSDKDKERDHERRMFEQQIQMQDKRFVHDSELRTMDMAGQEAANEWSAIAEASRAQAEEAKAAGGWVLSLSASVRPVLSYWFVALYTLAKFATLYLAMQNGIPFAAAVRAAYTEFDGTILAAIVSFYFADRSLRKR
jgi:hypothetical protein